MPTLVVIPTADDFFPSAVKENRLHGKLGLDGQYIKEEVLHAQTAQCMSP